MTSSDASQNPPAPKSRSRTRWRRWLVRALLALFGMLIGGELFARYYLGLGDPPLSMEDPQIEYLFKPSMTYHRAGHTIHYNAYSMRSEDFPARKSSPDELRVMVLGDSVINGGAPTDDSELATRLLEADLSRDLRRAVIVGNISAASWGPPNLLAYAKKFGLFDADVVVIVLSSHDYADAPTFVPTVDIDPTRPGHRPWCALQEAFGRYVLPRFLHADSSASAPETPPEPSQKDIDRCSQSLRDLINLARSGGARVILAQHLEAAEQPGQEKPGHAVIRAIGQECDVPIVQLGPAFNDARKQGNDPWRDTIHPNAAGQRIMADALGPIIESLVRQSTTAPAATMDSAPRKR